MMLSSICFLFAAFCAGVALIFPLKNIIKKDYSFSYLPTWGFLMFGWLVFMILGFIFKGQ